MAIARIKKLFDDPDFLIFDEIRLGSGSSFKIKDRRGFVLFEVEEDGNVKIKGRRIKT